MVASESQPFNHVSGISSVWILISIVHPEKAYISTFVTLTGISILVNEEQSLKAYSPMEVTLSGIVISVRSEHS